MSTSNAIGLSAGKEALEVMDSRKLLSNMAEKYFDFETRRFLWTVNVRFDSSPPTVTWTVSVPNVLFLLEY